MNQCFKILRLPLVAAHQAPDVLQPRVGPLDDPPALIPSEFAPVLVRGHTIVQPPRNNRLDLTRDQQQYRVWSCPHSRPFFGGDEHPVNETFIPPDFAPVVELVKESAP